MSNPLPENLEEGIDQIRVSINDSSLSEDAAPHSPPLNTNTATSATSSSLCSICLELFTNKATVLPCGHLFDVVCFNNRQDTRVRDCSLCKTPVMTPQELIREGDEHRVLDLPARVETLPGDELEATIPPNLL